MSDAGRDVRPASSFYTGWSRLGLFVVVEADPAREGLFAGGDAGLDHVLSRRDRATPAVAVGAVGVVGVVEVDHHRAVRPGPRVQVAADGVALLAGRGVPEGQVVATAADLSEDGQGHRLPVRLEGDPAGAFELLGLTVGRPDLEPLADPLAAGVQ